MKLEFILGLNRPHGSEGESLLLTALLDEYDFSEDYYGNLYILDNESSVAFTAHSDTVSYNRKDLYQKLSNKEGVIYLDDKHQDNVLGADCGTGVYIITRMLDAGVKGNYFIFRNEENGRIGSEYMLNETPEMFNHLKQMVSFDRKGTHDIVTTQMGKPCCSTSYGCALSQSLGMGHTAAAGSYTDSYTFNRVIPECTNISVGYEGAHTCNETQDTVYLEALIGNLIKVDWESLPIVGKELTDESSFYTFSFDKEDSYLDDEFEDLVNELRDIVRFSDNSEELINKFDMFVTYAYRSS